MSEILGVISSSLLMIVLVSLVITMPIKSSGYAKLISWISVLISSGLMLYTHIYDISFMLYLLALLAASVGYLLSDDADQKV
jgi:hypothetical protein